MQIEKYIARVRRLQSAQGLALSSGHQQIRPLHVLNRFSRNEMKRRIDISSSICRSSWAIGKSCTPSATMLRSGSPTPVTMRATARAHSSAYSRQLQKPLAKLLLSGAVADGETVMVTVKDRQLRIAGSKLADAT